MYILKLFQLIIRYFRKSIKRELFFVFVLIISIPIVFFILLSYNMAASSIQKDYVKYKREINSQITKNIDENINNLSRQSMAVYTNLNDLLFVLNTPENKEDIDYLQAYNRMSDYFQSVLESNVKINSISLINSNGKVIYYIDHKANSINLYNVKNEKWFKDALLLKGRPLVRELHYNQFVNFPRNEKPLVVSITRAIIDLADYTNKPLGVLVFDQNLLQFENIFNNIQTEKDEIVLVTGKTGNIIHTNKSITSKVRQDLISLIKGKKNGTSFDYYINNKKMLVIYSKSNDFNWSVISLLPYKSLQNKSSYLKNIFITLFIAVLGLGFLLSYIFSNAVTSPLNKLTYSFRQLKKGDFSTRIIVKGENEFSQIAYTFNDMSINIEKLIKEKYELALLGKQSELIALQNQINPHFLYNTLTSIKLVIDKGDLHNASFMVENLSDIFRYCLNKGANIVKFSQELEHIKNYLSIQKLRFGDKLEINYDIDEDVLSLPILRLTLQPIIENSIFHGLEPKLGKGELKITAKKFNDNFYIYIFDNGVGITQDKLNKINVQLKSDSSKRSDKLGIYNVNSRIKNYFGDEYGLTILSTLDSNTTIKIILPANNQLI
jgi:two-component system sensor histidine kinase YesM